MSAPGDYFAPGVGAVAAPVFRPDVARREAGAANRRRPPRLLIAVGLALLIVLVGGTLLRRAGAGPRPITIPEFMGLVPLRTDTVAADFSAGMKPLLRDMFGAAESTSAQYLAPRGIANLVAGRARMQSATSGDVRLVAPTTTAQFGSITCGNVQVDGQIRTPVVCWYISDSFSASLLSVFVRTPVFASMADQAAALEEAIPVMRDSASG